MTPETLGSGQSPSEEQQDPHPQHVSLAHRRREGECAQERPTQGNLLKDEWEVGFGGTFREKEEIPVREHVPLGIGRRGRVLLVRHIPGGGVIKICARNLASVYQAFPAHPTTGASSSARPHTFPSL